MENEPISYKTFKAITLQHDSWSAIWQLSRHFLCNKNARAKAVVLWIILSALYIVSFPTLVSAMSGYSANIEAFVIVNNIYVPFSEFVLVRYIIHDGWRVNLTGDYMVTAVPAEGISRGFVPNQGVQLH